MAAITILQYYDILRRLRRGIPFHGKSDVGSRQALRVAKRDLAGRSMWAAAVTVAARQNRKSHRLNSGNAISRMVTRIMQITNGMAPIKMVASDA